jgi:hypothetical protein
MTDDFTPLTEPDHWLGWLGEDPASAVRDGIKKMLREQVPSAALEWVRLTGPPEFLTGGRKDPDDQGKLIVTRAALAVPFELEVRSEGRLDRLRGVFSWVATGLDTGRKDRLHLDLDVDFETAKQALAARIYEPDAGVPPSGSTSRWWEFWRRRA